MNDLLTQIKTRTSSRGPYDPHRRISKKNLQLILEAARWTPTAHNMQNFEIIVVDDKKILGAITKLKRPVSETFIRENYRQLSFSKEELMKKKTGILASAFPSSWLAPDFRLLNFSRKEIEAMQGSFPAAPLYMIVVYNPGKRAPDSEGDFLGIISLGCAMENIWLMASSLGIGCHIVSSLSANPVQKEIKKILTIPRQYNIAFSCRLGYPVNEPARKMRVRRDIKTFVHRNKW